mmetsp:Transcript_8873/g.11429  ORF Transcript_8873/g.11429 Transcript_8873/m.11429 type:complete len:95 (-) Transcript_8873:304-588(-)
MVGFVLGLKLGCVEGMTNIDGPELDLRLGLVEGMLVGINEEIPDGSWDGASLGKKEEIVFGSIDGMSFGDLDGLELDLKLGSDEGMLVRTNDGV